MHRKNVHSETENMLLLSILQYMLVKCMSLIFILVVWNTFHSVSIYMKYISLMQQLYEQVWGYRQ